MGTTIAGISVLSGMPLEEGGGVCVGAPVSTGADDELIVGDAMVPEGDVAVARGAGPGKVCVIVTAPLVQVFSGSPSELN
jgi:hypothetical protein